MKATGTAGAGSPPSPFGPATQRYWDRRHGLFSRFDEGIQIDEEGLYSVKPEAIARHIGERLRGEVALDAFCGVGGSAIGLARAGKRVIAVDTDPRRLAMARHNARIYGVADRIEFVAGDCRERMCAGGFDCIYLDPPWGGPDYAALPSFTLAHFSPHGGAILQAAFAAAPCVALTVPRNFDWREFEAIDRTVLIERNGADERLLFRTAYFGL